MNLKAALKLASAGALLAAIIGVVAGIVILANGGSITQETRHWHEDTGTTSPGRVKSDADDYRYFPEPDLMPFAPTDTWLAEIRKVKRQIARINTHIRAREIALASVASPLFASSRIVSGEKERGAG